GIVRPSALAVVRLKMRSNLVACSTGRSAGFAPRWILSTSSPARLYSSKIGLLQRQAGGVAAWSCQGLDAPTGSPTALNTIGMTDVACLTAILGEVANVTITSTFKRTN